MTSLYGQQFLKGQLLFVTWSVYEILWHPCMGRDLMWRCRWCSPVLSSLTSYGLLRYWYLNAAGQKHKWKSKGYFQIGKMSNSCYIAVNKILFSTSKLSRGRKKSPPPHSDFKSLLQKINTYPLRECKEDFIQFFQLVLSSTIIHSFWLDLILEKSSAAVVVFYLLFQRMLTTNSFICMFTSVILPSKLVCSHCPKISRNS